MLLLLLSRFSHVRLCATPWTAAYQASPSIGFSRQKYWSGVPLPSPIKATTYTNYINQYTAKDTVGKGYVDSSKHWPNK